MLARGALYLAGSVRPICRITRLSRLQVDIGLQTEPTLEDVLTHFENTSVYCRTTTSRAQSATARLAGIFSRVYDFLGRQFENEELDTLEADPRARAITANALLWKPCLMDVEVGTSGWRSTALPILYPTFLRRRVRIRAAAENVDRGLQRFSSRRGPSTGSGLRRLTLVS